MRERANASATSAGTCAFIAQVRSSCPDDPNLRPAMNTTFGAFGSASICLRSSRSAAMHSMPAAVSVSRKPGSLKRATPITRLLGAARLASRASVGPILPPTPRMMRSPASAPNSAVSAADGVVITSSRCATSRKRSGSAVGRFGHAEVSFGLNPNCSCKASRAQPALQRCPAMALRVVAHVAAKSRACRRAVPMGISATREAVRDSARDLAHRSALYTIISSPQRNVGIRPAIDRAQSPALVVGRKQGNNRRRNPIRRRSGQER